VAALPVRRASALACILTLLASPALAAAPAVAAHPPEAVLGSEDAVTFTVRTDGDARLLQGATSVGTLEREEPPSAHEARFRWTQPTTRHPQVAQVSFWLAREDAAPELAVFYLPLLGRTELAVKTGARARVRVEAGGRTFGPVQADARGQAKVPIAVPPGVASAQVLGEHENGRTTSIGVPLPPAPVNPLAAVLSPSPLPPGGKGWLWVLSLETLDVDKLQVSVDGGTATFERAQGDHALYALVPAPGQTKLTATATLKGNPLARAQASVAITEPPPSNPVPMPVPMPGGQNALSRAWSVARERGSPSFLVGGYSAGGDNRGLGLGLGAGFRLDVLGGRVSAELELGLRAQAVNRAIDDESFQGQTLDAQLMVIPVHLGARYRVFTLGPVSLSGRAGVGALPFFFTVRSPQAFFASGLGGTVFAGAQVGYRLSALELLLEARGELSPLRTPELVAMPGGFFLSIGARFDPERK
jgi:hypothetical protein